MANICYLYRYYDEDERLLYVGISWDALRRFTQHKSRSDWANKVACIKIEKFPDRETAISREAEAIRSEHPLFNKSGATKRSVELLSSYNRYSSNASICDGLKCDALKSEILKLKSDLISEREKSRNDCIKYIEQIHNIQDEYRVEITRQTDLYKDFCKNFVNRERGVAKFASSIKNAVLGALRLNKL